MTETNKPRCIACGFEVDDDVFGMAQAAQHLAENENDPQHVWALDEAMRFRDGVAVMR